MWNSFERITWSFQNRLRLTYSTVPTSDEGDRLDADDPEDQGQQPAVPLDLAQQRVGDREGDEEEADVLQALGEVGRVERLQRVEDDEGGEQPGQRARGPGARRQRPSRAAATKTTPAAITR